MASQSASSSFKICESIIPGCLLLQPKRFEDCRGYFVKTFHQPSFKDMGLETDFSESFYSVSKKGVVRGMHFQSPPRDHVKVVYCAHGAVKDVVLDIRIGSPTYGHFDSFELSAAKSNMLYIPKGLAHGFCALTDQALVVYQVSEPYSPEYDRGIRWDSIGIPWEESTPLVSDRDKRHPVLADFSSPFVYELS
ncbi:dTDP-4-dehydrorhamnose 3,5-epimerase [Methylotuvimicrobium buryatense]|uniref:dTDP-4-dehydrorhamnose 3,5-epimerase n=1 Tax=Methylotuvimicrobium buryatense TaxID=95641 RepID=A0A4P9UTF8_METBY|nr:dTDP-4-dehydrorhamnose 3,5-epimerase [Methylotuvimicrobium buryatense]QCW83880.1 dTDP-4-dehydrorhamnose 3,5-epimerase [Methylotuvimicrobium buryatense]